MTHRVYGASEKYSAIPYTIRSMSLYYRVWPTTDVEGRVGFLRTTEGEGRVDFDVQGGILAKWRDGKIERWEIDLIPGFSPLPSSKCSGRTVGI